VKEGKEYIGEKLKRARKELGLTLQEVAKRTGFRNYQTLLNMEAGKREIKFYELVNLSRIFHKDLSFFFQEQESQISSPVFAWRDGQKNKRSKQIEARFSHILSNYHLVEKLTDEIKPPRLQAWENKGENLTFEKVTEKAEKFVEDFHLGNRPFLNLAQALEEKANIKMLYLSTERLGSAVSTIGDFGYGIIIDSDEAPWRRNFNLAHELFHFLSRDYYPLDEIHKSPVTTSRKPRHEKLADAFASALLMPCKYLLEEVNNKIDDNKIAWIDLVRIAIYFGVSAEALLWRLCKIGLLTDRKVKKIIESTEFRRINRNERKSSNRRANDYSNRFVYLSVKALRENKISVRKFCEIFEIDRSRLSEFISKYGLDIMEDVSYESEIELSGTRC